MKTKEEIKVLAENAFKDELTNSNQNINWIGYGKGIDGISKEKWIELWIKGYAKCEECNQFYAKIDEIFGKPLNEIYDIDKYEKIDDALSDISSGKLKPRTNLIRYSDDDLRLAISEAQKSWVGFPSHGSLEDSEVKFVYTTDEIIESIKEKK